MSNMNWSLSEVAAVLADELTQAVSGVAGSLRLIQTDSRQVIAGDLFVCLVGENFDAHDFAKQVCEAGALALVTNRLLDVPVTQFVVKDTRVALGVLARAWRQRFHLKVLAVVGSNGKTTSKEMLGSICKAEFGEHNVLVTSGNLNNEVGVPQTLFKLRDTHRVAVIEMGMNHPGEIDYLAGLVQPDVVLLTNAQREHQEFMKTLWAVAHENGSAFTHLPEQGVAVYPVSTEFESCWQEQSQGRRVVHFGHGADFELSCVAQSGLTSTAVLKMPGGTVLVKPSFLGEHNDTNAAGAAATASAAGCSPKSIVQGLENFRPFNGRLQVVLNTPSLLLIDDSYNANPDSVNAASKVLADQLKSQSTNTLLVLGDMGEVGDYAEQYHAEVGQFARQVGVQRLYSLGDLTEHTVRAFGDGAIHFKDVDALVDNVMKTIEQGRWSVLVKGSRFMKMERVVQALVKQYAGGALHAS